MSTFPTIESSFRFRPHAPFVTYVGPTPPDSNLADQTMSSVSQTNILIGHSETGLATIPTSHSTQEYSSLLWPLPHRASTTIMVHTTSSDFAAPLATSDADIEASNGDSLGSEISSMTSGAKIGVIIGVVVLVILSSLSFWFCVLNGRQRLKKWTAKKEARRNSELNMWETELHNGRAKKPESHVGLWDGLKVERNIQEADTVAGNEAGMLDKYEGRLQGVGMWEYVGETKNGARTGERNDRSHQQEKRTANSLSHLTRDRMSIVSSVGSVGPLTSIAPVHPRNVLER